MLYAPCCQGYRGSWGMRLSHEQEDGQMIPTEAIVSSVWRQGPGGDWKCCMHHVAKVIEEAGE